MWLVWRDLSLVEVLAWVLFLLNQTWLFSCLVLRGRFAGSTGAFGRVTVGILEQVAIGAVIYSWFSADNLPIRDLHGLVGCIHF